jgi:protein O-GlcNAc transferase
MGLPVLTCPGNTYVSRMAADILLNLGLDDFVCEDWNIYIRKAIDFCQKKSAKQLFNQHFDRSNPIFDSANFVRQFEAALLKIQN